MRRCVIMDAEICGADLREAAPPCAVGALRHGRPRKNVLASKHFCFVVEWTQKSAVQICGRQRLVGHFLRSGRAADRKIYKESGTEPDDGEESNDEKNDEQEAV